MIKSIFMTTTGGICDRCGRPIMNVFTVVYIDGSRQTFGSECVRKFIAPEGTKIIKTRMEQMAQYMDYRKCLAMDTPPVGSSSQDGDTYFVTDSKGESIFITGELVRWGVHGGNHWVFHTKYTTGGKVVTDKMHADYEKAKKEVDQAIDNLQKSIAYLIRKHGQADLSKTA